MDKKEYWEHINEEDRLLAIKYPEVNQSGCYDNEGNLLPKSKREQYDPIPRGFIDSGLIEKLTKKDIYIYFFLSSKCNPQRNTRIRTEIINQETKIPIITIKRSLRRLEFYHFIHRRVYSMGPKLKRRITTLQRWDSAYKKLVVEGKIKAISGKDTNPIITSYLPDKFKKSDLF